MTRRAYVIGHPISHSLSPAMHNAAFEALGLDARYEAADVRPHDLARWVASVREPDLLGFSVTVPHKEAIRASLDRVEGDALLAGAVSAVVRDGEGALIGANTDTAGFRRSLAEEAGTSLAGRRVVLLGAGGAARAVATVALQDGAGQLTVINRHRQRAEQLVADLAPACRETRVHTLATDDPEAAVAISRAEVLINATSVGMSSSEIPVDPGLLGGIGLVVDIVYNPPVTALLHAARSHGVPTLAGLGMLVFQGAAAFERWTGLSAPVPIMRAAAGRVLSERNASLGV